MGTALLSFSLLKRLNAFDALDGLRARWAAVGAAASGAAAAERAAVTLAATGGVVAGGGGGAIMAAEGAAGGALAARAAGGTMRPSGLILPAGVTSVEEAAAIGGGASLLARGGALASRAAGVLGRVALPLAAIQYGLGVVGTSGGIGDRLQGGASSLTFGLVPGPQSGDQIAQKAAAANARYQQLPVSTLGQQRQSIASIQARIAHLQQHPGHAGGLLGSLSTLPGWLGGGSTRSNYNKQIADELKDLRGQLQQRRQLLLQSEQAMYQQLDRLSIAHADSLATNFVGAFDVLRKARGPEAAMRETVSHVIGAMHGLRREGQLELGDTMLAWAHQQARENPKLVGEYHDLIESIKKRFTDLGRHIQIVNDQIYTGSKQEWAGIAAAMANPVERAKEQVSRAFSQVQREALASLMAMGFSRSQATQFVQGLEKGGASATATTNLIAAGPAAVTGAQVSDKTLTGMVTSARRAGGGRIPGLGTADVVRMSDGGYGAPGELVVNHWTEADVDRDLTMAGKRSLGARVSSETRPNYIPRYRAVGGRTVGSQVILQPGVNMTYGQEPRILQALRGFSSEEGEPVYVISGYRSPAHSVAVGGFADDPHTRGLAADIGLGSPTLASMFSVPEQALRAIGLWRPFYPGSRAEANHVQLLSGGARGTLTGPVGGATNIAALRAPRSNLAGVPGALVNRAGLAFAAAVTARINQTLATAGGGMSFAGVPGTGGSASANQALGRAMMLAAGWGADQWPSLLALWNQESGWNSRAVNPSSGAYGIPQALGHGHPYALGDARSQIAWGLNYIRSRYGSPETAEAHERRFNWYAGGADMVVRRPTVFGAGEAGPERVRITPVGRDGGSVSIGRVQVNVTGGISERRVHKLLDKRLQQFAQDVAAEIEAGAEESHHGAIG